MYAKVQHCQAVSSSRVCQERGPQADTDKGTLGRDNSSTREGTELSLPQSSNDSGPEKFEQSKLCQMIVFEYIGIACQRTGMRYPQLQDNSAARPLKNWCCILLRILKVLQIASNPQLQEELKNGVAYFREY